MKYRKVLLADDVVEIISEVTRGLAERYDMEFERLGCDRNHIHLSRLCFQRQELGGQEVLHLPRPYARQAAIFAAWGITPPTTTRPAKAQM